MDSLREINERIRRYMQSDYHVMQTYRSGMLKVRGPEFKGNSREIQESPMSSLVGLVCLCYTQFQQASLNRSFASSVSEHVAMSSVL